MSAIDRRIVDMQFNNGQFNDGIRESMSALDGLQGALGSLGGGLVDGLGDAISGAAGKFSALETVVMGSLMRIGARIADFGVQMGHSLMIAPISDGFSKYEQMVGAQQTIINATGLSMGEVNEQLARLNRFTDETSFKLVDMVTNIGKFTGAGIELETAVTAMQGIGNYAALSGMNIQQTSSAMGVFAKAIGQGALQLGEWRQIENMNGATVEFKELLMDTAFELGTLQGYFNDDGSKGYVAEWANGKTWKTAEVSVADFSSALTESKWLSGDVIMEAMNRYGAASKLVMEIIEEQGVTANEAIRQVEAMGDETLALGLKAFKAAQEAKTFTDALDSVKDAVSTGWMNTFQIIFGDYEEAKALWTAVADELWEVFASGAEARNEMLGEWKALGGRDDLMQGFAGLWAAIRSVAEPIAEAFRNIFPPIAAERLRELTERFKEFTEGLEISGEAADRLRRVFEGLFSVAGFLIDGLKFLWDTLSGIAGVIFSLGGGFLEALARVGDWVVGLREAAQASDLFGRASAKIVETFETIFNLVGDLSVAGFEFLKNLGATIAEDFAAAVEKIRAVFEGTSLAGALESVAAHARRAAEGVKEAIDGIAEYFGRFSGIDLGPLRVFASEVEIQFRPFTFAAELVTGGLRALVAAFDWALPHFQRVAEFLAPVFSAIWDAIMRGLEALGIDSFRDIFDPVVIAVIVASLTGFFNRLTTFVEQADGFADGINGVLNGVTAALEGMQQRLKSEALKNVAMAVGILAAALFVLSRLDGASLAVALTGITALMAELTGMMLLLSNRMGPATAKQLAGLGVAMAAVANAILILAAACKILSGIDEKSMGVALMAIFLLLAQLVGFARLVGTGEGLWKIGLAMIPLALGVLLLSQAVKSLAGLSWGEMVQGLVGLGTALGGLLAFSKYADPKGMLAAGAAMFPLAAGLYVLARAVNVMAGMEINAMHRGLYGLAGALGAVVLASKFIEPRNLLALGVSMLGVGVGMAAIAGALGILTALDPGGLGAALLAMVAVLAALTLASKFLKPKNMLALGLSLLGVGAGLNLIAAAMLVAGQMDWGQVGRSLVALGGALLVLAAASKAIGLQGLAGAAAIAIMAGALAVMAPALMLLGSMDMANIGRALLLLVGVFVIFGAAALLLAPVAPLMLALSVAVALLGAGVFALGVGLVALAAGLAAMAAGAAVAKLGVDCLVDVLAALLVGLALAAGEALVALLEVLAAMLPLIFELVGGLIAGTLEILIDNAPAFFVWIGEVLQGIYETLVEFLPKFFELVGIWLDGVLDLVLEFVPKAVETFLSCLLAVLELMAEHVQPTVEAALEIVAGFLRGVAEGIPGVAAAGADVIIAFLEAIGTEVPRIVDAGFRMAIDLMNGIADAIRNNKDEVAAAAMNLGGAIVEGILAALLAAPKMVMEGALAVCESIWGAIKGFFKIKSPSGLTEEAGGHIVAGLLKGLSGGAGKLADKARELCGKFADGLSGMKDGAKTIAANCAETLGETLKDNLSKVTNAAKKLGEGILKGVKGALGIKSPARAMIAAAHDTGDGLILGLADMARPVAKSAEDLGGTARDGLADALRGAADGLDGITDDGLSPTITPVIDMADVERGLAETFGAARTLDVGGVREKAAGSLQERGQNGREHAGRRDADARGDEFHYQITVHNHVRNDTDIDKINSNLGNLITKLQRTKGMVTARA